MFNFLRRTKRRKTTFVHAGQKYVVEGHPGPGDHILTLKPHPAIKGTRTEGFANTKRSPWPCEAHVDFKVLTETYGRFCGIEVPEERQRQGVGRAMILALFSHYPDVVFHNTALNSKSGPFFQRLQAEFPDHLAPISDHQILD